MWLSFQLIGFYDRKTNFNMAVNDTNLFILISFFIWFIMALLIVPPTEFISAGLTVQNIFAKYLGSENIEFVYFHIRRSSVTLVIHSIFPLCYYILIGFFMPELQLSSPWNVHIVWQYYLIFSVSLIVTSGLTVLYWSRHKWNNHPIARELSLLAEQNSGWRAVAASINMEFRRIDKFSSGLPTSHRIIVTDSWVLKTSTYYVYAAHQNDIHLNLEASEEHNISYENMTAVQFIHIKVASINPKLSSFTLRMNALEYKDLKDKLQSPIRNAKNIVIRQTLSEQFLQAFAEQVVSNPLFHPPGEMDIETCIGCMQKRSDIKLQKKCDALEAGECTQCYCRPMWCLECMGKWFASRQDQARPETWLGGKSPCPTCRAMFCLLDVCKIQS